MNEFNKLVYKMHAFLLKIKKLLKHKEVRFHTIGWSLFFLTDIFFGVAMGASIPGWSYIKNTAFVLLFFYLLLFGAFIPYLPKKILKSILLAIIILFGFTSLKLIFDYSFDKPFLEIRDGILINISHEIWRFSTMAFYSFAYWIYLQRLKEQKQLRATEKKLLETEINFLKAQINPHFMFNTLNFVYDDVARVSATSGKAIMTLTKLMRYSVESTKNEKSSLIKELEAIQEYINLQGIRFGSDLFVNYSQSGAILFFSIPPLVLISLVENAFKYGIHDDSENPIEIEVAVSHSGLKFRCKNRKRLDFKDKETTAIGLGNVIRRLEMAFAERFTLETDDTDFFYEVKLELLWV